MLATDFRPMRGGIARLVGSVVDFAPDDVEWRCLTLAPGPPEPNVVRYASFPGLCRSIPGHARWLRGAAVRRVVCTHAYLQPPALLARLTAGAQLTTFVYGTEIIPMRLAHRGALSLLRFSQRVIADSAYSAAETVSTAGVAENRLVVVHPRFRSPWLRTEPPRRREGNVGLRLVTVSRLADIHKNLELAIRAVSVLAGTGLIDRYVVVGDGPQRQALMELARTLGVDHLVDFPGALDDTALADVVCRCHLGLFPSRRVDNFIEGFGMIVHELAGAGLPVLVGRSGGTHDACPGEWAVPLDPDDLVAWVGWMERLAVDEDLRFRLATAAYEWALGVDTADTARDYADVISRA